MKDTLKYFGIKVATNAAYSVISIIVSYATESAIKYVAEQRAKRRYITIEIKD